MYIDCVNILIVRLGLKTINAIEVVESQLGFVNFKTLELVDLLQTLIYCRPGSDSILPEKI